MLAIVPPWIDPRHEYIQVGILIALVSVCLGLMIEQHFHGEQVSEMFESGFTANGDRIVGLLKDLSAILAAPPECKACVEQLVAKWELIGHRGDVGVFREIRTAKAAEFVNSLGELASGAVTVGIDSPYSVRSRPFDDVASYRAVSVGPLEFWQGRYGQHYLAEQGDAITEHGVIVERVFVIDDGDQAIAEPIIRAQVAAGVKVWVVLDSQIPDAYRAHVVDQGVITFAGGEALLMQPLAPAYGRRADRERLSLIAAEIAAAEFSLSQLKHHAVPIQTDTSWPYP